jgi:hypothetical protein
MQFHQPALADEPRLRIVFADTSVAMGLPAGSTLGDIAEWVGDLARSRKGQIRSIDVRMSERLPAFAAAR